MNKFFSIAFFILVWLTCTAQPTFTVYAINADSINVGHITFKPEIKDGFVFYHLEYLGKKPFQDCTFIVDEPYQGFLNAYNQLLCKADFNLVLMDNNLERGEEYTSWFFPTLIKTACDCELPTEIRLDQN